MGGGLGGISLRPRSFWGEGLNPPLFSLIPPPLWADVEVDVDELNQEQVADLNKQATTYGMAEGDFVRYGTPPLSPTPPPPPKK